MSVMPASGARIAATSPGKPAPEPMSAAEQRGAVEKVQARRRFLALDGGEIHHLRALVEQRIVGPELRELRRRCRDAELRKAGCEYFFHGHGVYLHMKLR